MMDPRGWIHVRILSVILSYKYLSKGFVHFAGLVWRMGYR